MMVMNLYEITELQQAAEQEDDAEIKQDLQEVIEFELEKKSNNIIYAIKNLEGNNLAIDAEIERLRAIKEKNVKNVDSIKNHILNFMKTNNIDKIQTDLATFSTRKSKSTQIDSIELLPQEFVTVKQTFQPDKTAIKKAIESGREVAGANVIENISLQIK
jgi:hypothetical protein